MVDRTVIWIVEQISNLFLTRRVITMAKESFEAQEEKLYGLIPYLRRICIDESGLGRQFAERAIKRFGASKVEGVTFTGPVKEDLAYPVRSAFESKRIRVPKSTEIRCDISGIRKETTLAGNIRFAGERNANGHCDRFWALALALHAAKQPVTGAITDPKQIRYGGNSTTLGRGFRPGTFTPRRLGQGVFQGYFET
jgi:phage FluMu gp28-like protein